MKRAAWINQALAIWLIGFFVLGLPERASAADVVSHGVVALLLLLASWRVITESIGTIGPSAVQLAAGVWLVLTPYAFAHPSIGFVRVNDVVIGSIASVDALVELWMSAPRSRYFGG